MKVGSSLGKATFVMRAMTFPQRRIKEINIKARIRLGFSLLNVVRSYLLEADISLQKLAEHTWDLKLGVQSNFAGYSERPYGRELSTNNAGGC